MSGGVRAQIGSGFSGFFGWWFGELSAMLPFARGRADRGGRAALAFELGETALTVTLEEDGKVKRLAEITQARPGGAGLGSKRLRREVKRHVRRHGRSRVLVLRLPSEDALRRRLRLPLAAEEGLRDVLSFEMDRQTPFKAEDVNFDYRVLSRDRTEKRLEVEIIVAPREVVARALALAHELGLEPDAVDVALEGPSGPGGPGKSPDGGWYPNLLPPERRTLGPSPLTRLNRLLFLLALILAGMAIYQPLERERMRAEDMAAQVAAARKEANKADDLRRETDRLTREGRFLGMRKEGAVLVTVLLDEVTRLVPDGSWLTQLKLQKGEVRLIGYSPAASRLIEAVEGSKLFEGARFRSPVTLDQRMGLERFDLSARVVVKGEATDDVRPGTGNGEAEK